jgi:hypothetical protein
LNRIWPAADGKLIEAIEMIRPIFLTALLGISNQSLAQNSIELPSIPGDSVLFRSDADKRIYFNISGDEVGWTEVSIDPGEEKLVHIGGNTSQLFIAIRTGDKVWRGTVKPKLRYVLRFASGQYAFLELK